MVRLNRPEEPTGAPSGPVAAKQGRDLAACSDEVLVSKAKTGQDGAYGELASRYWRVAVAVAFAELGDHHCAEDVAQQGFLTGYQRLQQVRHPRHFLSWLLKIVARDAKKVRQRNRNQPVMFSEHSGAARHGRGQLPDPSAQPAATSLDKETHVLGKEEKGKVWEAVHKLKPPDRAIVLLRYLEGLSFRAISDRTGRSEGALRVRVHRLLRHLKGELTEYFEEI